MDIFERLESTISERRTSADVNSYVAKLQRDGIESIAKKLGEEAVETVIAALASDKTALTAEAADLLFHLLILLEARGVSLESVKAELTRREGRSGLDEKASRKG